MAVGGMPVGVHRPAALHRPAVGVYDPFAVSPLARLVRPQAATAERHRQAIDTLM
jgi:hypothetical protein